jgi:glucokinase
MTMSVGIDLSGLDVRAVTVDSEGVVTGRWNQANTDVQSVDAVRAALRSKQSSTATTPRTGIALHALGEPLSSDVSAALADDAGIAPVIIGSGSAMVLAEAWCGTARGCRNVVTFSAGEHVAAGVLVDGEVLQGANGSAALVAWLSVNPVDRDDYRRYGPLEAEVGAPGIVRRLVWRIKSGDRSGVAERVGGDLGQLTADHVIDAARAGDGVCISVIRDSVRYVSIAVTNLATILDPECVVLGGMLAKSADMMLEPIRAECRRRLRPAQAARLQILASTLGPDAAAIGAARAALLHHQ